MATVTHPNGKTLTLVAQRRTTPLPADAPKPIYIEREMIEVLVFDSMPNPASVMGHAAIEVRGVTYNRQAIGYLRMKPTAYIQEQALDRDIIGLRLWVTPMEADKLQADLESRVKAGKKYHLLKNSCSTNTAYALENIGILAHDPRNLQTPITPAELLSVVSKSNRVVERRLYPKGWKHGASADW
ncbi:hypothetical protein [Cupriavidus nantongensis]|uniref:hypothetical protein n=1 Tax=Cupriavidus nantongensis TaxID=1796606 RepID=UPI00224638AF|nr:hypothetical protein [Cupriavidus nantongensis]